MPVRKYFCVILATVQISDSISEHTLLQNEMPGIAIKVYDLIAVSGYYYFITF